MVKLCIGLLLFVSACSERDQPQSKLSWSKYVVYSQEIEPYTLDYHAHEFAGATLIQGSGGDSSLVLASMNTYEWDKKFSTLWRETRGDKSTLWAVLPTPHHVWSLHPDTRDAVYVGAAGWQDSTDIVLVDALTAKPRERRRVLAKLPPEKPRWWPSQYVLSSTTTNNYGLVMPGHEAVYYSSSGIEGEETYDIWGSIPHYTGDAKFVVKDVQSQDIKIAVITLKFDGIHTGLSSVMLSQDGEWVVATCLNENKVWVFSLREVWAAFDDSGDGSTGDESTQKVGAR